MLRAGRSRPHPRDVLQHRAVLAVVAAAASCLARPLARVGLFGHDARLLAGLQRQVALAGVGLRRAAPGRTGQIGRPLWLGALCFVAEQFSFRGQAEIGCSGCAGASSQLLPNLAEARPRTPTVPARAGDRLAPPTVAARRRGPAARTSFPVSRRSGPCVRGAPGSAARLRSRRAARRSRRSLQPRHSEA